MILQNLRYSSDQSEGSWGYVYALNIPYLYPECEDVS